MYLAFSLSSVYQGIIDIFSKALGWVLMMLPLSPFANLMQYALTNELLQFLNYLLPIGALIVITEGWLTAIATFYVWQVILRWVKACE